MAAARDTWEQHATEEERRTCPDCGIALYWIKRCHPANWERVQSCGHSFHDQVSAPAVDGEPA